MSQHSLPLPSCRPTPPTPKVKDSLPPSFTAITMNSALAAARAALLLAAAAACILGGYGSAALDPVGHLTTGESVSFNVTRASYSYFDLQDLQPNQAIVVGLTVYAGDADLYMDCTLNPTGTADGTPSNRVGHHKWSSLRVGNDFIRIPADDAHRCPPGFNYTIAVHGWHDSVGSLSVLVGDESVLELSDGRPVEWWVLQHEHSMFSYSLPATISATHPDLLIDLSAGYAELQLYASVNGVASRSSHDYASADGTTSAQHLRIPASAFSAGGDFTVSVAVYGVDPGSFTIVASANSDIHLVEGGEPLQGYAPYKHYRFYSFSVARPACNITVSVTPLNGDTDLFVDTEPRPTLSHHSSNWLMSRKFRTVVDSITLSNAVIGKYYLSVYAYDENCTFTVSAASTCGVDGEPIQRLANGVPQGGDAEDAGQWRYYAMPAPMRGPGSVKVAVTVASGSVQVFANVCPTEDFDSCSGRRGTYDYRPHDWNLAAANYSGNDNNAHALVIDTDTSDGTPEEIIVGVRAEEPSTEFLVVGLSAARGENETITLQLGTPIVDIVRKSEYSFFRVVISEPHQDFQLTVTAFVGDPDVFISRTIPHPTAGWMRHTWAAARVGSDSVNIEAADPRACHAASPAQPCVYYVGIRAYSATSFTVLASVRDTTPTRLALGMPQTGQVNHSQADYYIVVLGESHDTATVTLSPLDDGDVDLYIRVANTSSATVGRVRGAHDFASVSATQVEVIEITKFAPARQRACPPGTRQCLLLIEVYGYSATGASYELVAGTDTDPIRLRDWSPLPAFAGPGKWEFFQFSVGAGYEDSPLEFVVTPTTADPDLFVTTNPAMKNSQNVMSYTWSSRKTGTSPDAVRIEPHDARRMCGGSPCETFYIAVNNFAHTGTARFSVAAGFLANSTSSETLLVGRAAGGSGNSGSFRYYDLAKGADEVDIVISLTVLRGYASFYVSREQDPADARKILYPRHRTNGWGVDPSTWTSPWRGSAGRGVTIRTSHPKYCVTCSYHLGVYSITNSEFTISWTTKQHRVLLRDGVAYADGAHAAGKSQLFVLGISVPNAAVSVGLTLDSGSEQTIGAYIEDENAPAGSVPVPTWQTTGQPWQRSMILHMQLHDAHCNAAILFAAECNLVIEVSGNVSATYTLIAHVDRGFDSPIQLVEGQNLGGQFVAAHSYTYYMLPVDLASYQTIVVTPTYLDSDPDLYVRVGAEPGRAYGEHDYLSLNSHGDDVVVIQPTDPALRNCNRTAGECNVYVAVYGFHDAFYSIRYSADGMQPVRLQSGQLINDAVERGRYEYFTFHVADTSELTIILDTPRGVGDPDMYISSTYDPLQLPTRSRRDTWQWEKHTIGADVSVIHSTDPNFKSNTDWIIAVYGYSNTTFSLQVLFDDDIIPFPPRTPVQGRVSTSSWRYYSIERVSTNQPIHVSITATQGNPMLAVRARDQGLPGLDSQHHLAACGPGSCSLLIDSSTSNSDSFVIGVFGHEGGASYTLRVALGDEPMVLRHGEPLRSQAKASRNTRFVYELASRHRVTAETGSCDISVKVTAVTGNPFLAVSMNENVTCFNLLGGREPSCSHVPQGWSAPSLWSGRWHGADVEIDYESSALLREGYLFVDVFAANKTDTTFQVQLIEHCDPPMSVDISADSPKQKYTTVQHLLCLHRDPKSGLCTGTRDQQSYGQSAFFKLAVDAGDITEEDTTLSFQLWPSSGDDGSTVPLTMYLTSCLSSACVADDKYPGPHRYSALVSTGSPPTPKKIYTSSAAGGDSLYCTPGAGQDPCIYFVGVYPTNLQQQAKASFLLAATTPKGTVLVPEPPAQAMQSAGIIVRAGDEMHDVGPGTPQRYEIPTTREHDVAVRMELCSGQATLSICRPEASQIDCSGGAYKQFSVQAGTHAGSKGAQPSVTLDQSTSESFLTITGNGLYNLYVDFNCQTKPCEHLSVQDRQIKTADVSGTAVKLNFKLPDLVSATGTRQASHATFLIYAIEVGAAGGGGSPSQSLTNAVLYTPCGLDAVPGVFPTVASCADISECSASDVSQGVLSLRPQRRYLINVVAACDASCIAGRPSSATVNCQDEGVICTAYDALEVDTTDDTGSSNSGMSSGAVAAIVITSVVVFIAVGAGAYVLHQRRVAAASQSQYHVQDLSSMGGLTLSFQTSSSQPKYQSLLSDDQRSEIRLLDGDA